jgi:RNA polymerase sigma-70 factor (ECF subfamily)
MAEPGSADAADIVPGDFAEIVRRHQSMVFSIALRFLADPPAAEELAQDVFMQLHGKLNTLKSPGHVVFWLRKVTSHRCIDRMRRNRMSQLSLDDLPESAMLEFSPDVQPADPFLSRRLQQLVASLPGKARLMVILRYQEDLSAEDIAKVLDMPAATVKSHLQRALAMLRDKVVRTMGEMRTDK